MRQFHETKSKNHYDTKYMMEVMRRIVRNYLINHYDTKYMIDTKGLMGLLEIAGIA